jgi:adenine-specific DNA-methyltransferase
MPKKEAQKVNLTSSNLSLEKLAELRRILPDAFSEEKIDWEKLRTVLGDSVDAHIEKFCFTWAGKNNAIKNVLIPSKATLNPAPDESVKFDESENLFIEGDNLEVLKLLQKAYFEKVKMIYIDPPYNTGGDFVYKDNFTAPLDNYLHQTGQKNGNGEHLTTNKETNGRFHSDWLSMMYPRLKLAWNLLCDDGVIFVSIDDNEVHHLRMILDEVFGEENFVGELVHQRAKGGGQAKYIVRGHDYILVYAKQLDGNIELKRKKVVQQKIVEIDGKEYIKNDDVVRKTFGKYDKSLGDRRCFYEELEKYKGAAKKKEIDEKLASKELLLEKLDNGMHVIYELVPLEDASSKLYSIVKVLSEEGKKDLEELELPYFDYPKPVELVRQLVESATFGSGSEDIVLDFFGGSGTTAQAVMAQNAVDNGNRKFILVQLPEKTDEESTAFKAGYKTIADFAKERVRRAAKKLGNADGFKVFKLAESNYPENTFEFDPGKTEEENKSAFEGYLKQAKRSKLIDDIDETGIIYENIVKEGFSLNSKIQEGVPGNNKVYTITDGDRQFSICLDRSIDDTTVKNITEWVKGVTFICFDNALSDSQKANLGLHVELKTI